MLCLKGRVDMPIQQGILRMIQVSISHPYEPICCWIMLAHVVKYLPPIEIVKRGITFRCESHVLDLLQEEKSKPIEETSDASAATSTNTSLPKHWFSATWIFCSGY